MRKIKNIIFEVLIICVVIALYIFSGIYLYTNFRERKRLEISSGIVKEVDKQIKINKEKIEENEKKDGKDNDSKTNLTSLPIKKEIVVNYGNTKYTIVGKVIINKININEPIIKENTKSALDTAIIKMTGPDINSYGNVVIGGHNFMKGDFFIKIDRLVSNDVVTIVDASGNSVDYYVTEYKKTAVADASYLKQPEDKSIKMITLVTCTKGGLQRYYVKAVAK